MGDRRTFKCPGCDTPISMIAAVGQDQRWAIKLSPGPSGFLQAATIAGTIDGAQKLMRLSCREDGANVQTYVERIDTNDGGEIEIQFVTMATSKKWAAANGRADTQPSPEQSS